MAKDSWGKVKNLLGLEIEDEYEDDEFEEEYEEEEVEERPVYKSKAKKDKGIAMTTATTAEKNSKVLVVEPVLFNDAPVICDNLKRNKTIVANLEKADFEEGRKIFDFLNGAVYALDGTIQKISENVFILAPNTVDVIAESIDSSATSDLLNWKFDK